MGLYLKNENVDYMENTKIKKVSNRLKKEFICENNKTRLDKFLVENFPDLSRSKIQSLIENGNIKVNGDVVNIKHSWLSKNDKIEIKSLVVKKIKEEKIDKSALADKVKIVSECDDYIVLEKPAGLIVHGAKDIIEYSLVDFLKAKYPGIEKIGEEKRYRPGIVHRLDKTVSGLMVVARSEKMYKHLKSQFQNRETIKKYYTLVYGVFDKNEGVVDFPIKRSKRSGKMVAMPKGDEGKDALTYFFVEHQFNHYTFLDVLIKTGRSHQIRAHMHAIDHPIIGDDLYKSRKYKDKFNLSRTFLHSHYLEFTDLEGKRKKFNSRLPKELQRIIDNLI